MASSNYVDKGYSATSIRNGLVAGYSAGICGIVVGHPLDSIKVLLQAGGGVPGSQQRSISSAVGNGSSSSAITQIVPSGNVLSRASASSTANVAQAQSSSAVKANMSTVAAEIPLSQINNSLPSMFSQDSKVGKRSLRTLYAGVTGPLLTIGILQSLNFAIYDSVRREMYQRQLQSQNGSNDLIGRGQADDYLHYDNLFNVATASAIAGGVTSVLTSPMIIVKTKQQLMVWGFRKAIRETYSSGGINGLRNFYTGFGFHFFCDIVGRSVYMFSYEYLKRKMAQMKESKDQTTTTTSMLQYSNNGVSTNNLTIPERMICAATAGMTCWAFIFPADVVRSKLYAKSLSSQKSLTTMDGIQLARNMVKEQGIKSLYRGMGITVLRAGPVAAAVLPVYDSMLAWVSSS